MEENNIVHVDNDNKEPEKETREAPQGFEKKNAVPTKGFNAWWLVLYLGIIAVFMVLGAYTGLFVARMKILDIEKAVTDYQQHVTTRIIDGKGTSTVSELAEERRVLIGYDQIPASFVSALIAIEDKDFLKHPGVDIYGIARAFVKNMLSGRVVQGGSTISQQLIKNLFLSPEQTYTRKIREAILALQLEAKYTKQEIIGFYCNTIYFGHRRYGLEAASRYYFGHPATELSLEEAAMLAGVIRAPQHYSPVNHPERAVNRRNLVLTKMAELDFIDPDAEKSAKEQPLRVKAQGQVEQIGDYFIEEVRRFLVNHYGREQTLGGGLTVYSTVDMRMQAIAEKAVKTGLYELSMRQRLRPIEENVIERGLTVEEYSHSSWNADFEDGDYTYGVVSAVENKTVTLLIAGTEVPFNSRNIPSRMMTAQARNNLTKYFKVGDILPVRINKITLVNAAADGEEENLQKEITSITITQEPEAEAGLVAIEAQSGRVLAMVGGYNYAKNQFNNAVQARRQTGSAFKPIVIANAIETGSATLGSTIFDEPTVFNDPGAPELYEPENYKKKYVGITTVRNLLEESRNIPAIKLMLHSGINETIALAKRMGIDSELSAVYSLALGSIETTLIDMVGVYSAFPNQGVAVEPYIISKIEDGDGNIMYQHITQPKTAMKPSTAFLTTQAMLGVVLNGTGKSAIPLIKKHGVPLAGKTGTTDDYTDAWFVGFSPQIVCGVWVGNKEKVTLGDDESGAVAALPIWRQFMDSALETEEWRKIRTYEIPSNVVAAQVDRRNGLLASEFTPVDDIIIEFFIRGTEPTKATSYDDDYNLRIQPIRLMEKRVTIDFEDDDRVIPRDFYETQW